MSRSLRVALLSEHASPAALLGGQDAGGQNVYVDEVARGLAALGHRIDIFTRRDGTDDRAVREWAPGVRIIDVAAGPACVLSKDELWPVMPGFRDGVHDFIASAKEPYDLLHGNFWMSGWVACEIGSWINAPVIQIFHATGLTKKREQGGADRSPAARIPIEREVVRRANRVIAQCPAEEQELIADYLASPASVALIPSAVDTNRFQPVDKRAARRRLGLSEGGDVIVYVGRMMPRKDVGNLLRALAILSRSLSPESIPTLLLVGGETSEPDPIATPEIGELRQLAAELGIQAHVRFSGRRQPDELGWYYGAADVAVTTPWYEPFGLTPLEAMACGRPVIGSDVGGISFTIRHGETGFLVPPRDPEALARRLQFLLANPALQEKMGLAARQRVVDCFTWSVVAKRTANLYQELLETEPRPDALPVGAMSLHQACPNQEESAE